MLWALLAGCMTVIGWYFEAVSTDLIRSAGTLTIFYLPATNMFLFCVTMPYFVMLVMVVLSDAYALRIALRR